MMQILIVFLCLDLAFSANIVSAEVYTKEDMSIMGDRYSVGVFDLTFDEDLSVYRTYGNCPSVACYNWTCVPCDFTDPAICNGTKRPYTGNFSNDCGGCVDASNPPIICLSPTLWSHPSVPPLVGNAVKLTVSPAGLLIPHHPTPPDNCSSMVVKVTALTGGATGSLIWYASAWTGNNHYDFLARWTYNVICPYQPPPLCSQCGWGQTVVILLVPDDDVLEAEVLLEIEWVPLPYTNPNKYLDSCALPDGLTTSTHQCIPEAIQQTIVPTVVGQVFRFVVTTNNTLPSSSLCPGILYVSVSIPIILVSTTDPWVSSINSSTAFRTPNFDGVSTVPGVWGICIQPGDPIYVWAYTTTLDTFTIIVATNREWIVEESIDQGPHDYFRGVMSSVTVNCGNKSFTPYTRLYSTLETMDTGSANVRMVYPSDRVDLFYPQPIFAPVSWFSLNLPEDPVFIPRKLLVSVVLSQRLQSNAIRSGAGLSFPYDYEFLTSAEWNTCTLYFNGVIFGNTTGLPIFGSVVDFTQKQFTCNSTVYGDMSSQIKSLQAADPDVINQLRYEQGLLMTSNDFYFCEQGMLGYATLTPAAIESSITDVCVASFDTPEFTTDQCCVFNPLAPYAQCQVDPRNISGQYTVGDYNISISQCPTSACAEDSLASLVQEKSGLNDPNQCGESNSFQAEKIDVRVYWDCIQAIFGEDPIVSPGPTCVHDADCDLISSGSICSSRTKRCLLPIAVTEPLFIACIYSNLTQFTRNYVAGVFNLNASDPNILGLWQDAFSSNLSCSDKHSPIGYPMYDNVVGVCGYCLENLRIPSFLPFVFIFSPGDNYAAGGQDCWNGPSTCSYTDLTYPTFEFCSMPGCNTINFLPYDLLGPGYCFGPVEFCGVCEDDFYCVDVTSLLPVGSCGNGSYVCVLANGSTVITPDAATCQNTMSCTASDAADQGTCVASGSCSDVSDYAISVLKGYSGGCVFDLRYQAPFDTTTLQCGSFRQTILGCINYAVDQSGCLNLNFSYGDPNVIRISGVKWITPATTEAQCDAYGNYCADDVIKSITNSYSSIYNLHPTPSCVDLRKLYTWTPGRWLGGQPRVPKATATSYSNRWNSTGRYGLDLNYIYNTITASVNKIQTLQTESFMFCETHYISYLDELVCSCVEGKDQSLCFGNRDNISAIGVACDESTNITTPISILKLVKTSVPTATCLSLYISEPSITLYQDASITDLRTLLVNYQEDTAWAIRNSQNAIVAKVLTDGWSSSFSNTNIYDVTLCLALSVLRLDYLSATGFPIIDVATRLVSEDFTTLQPADLEVNVTISGQYFCVALAQLESNRVYHFVQRIPDWETASRVVFSDGEIVYLSILLAFYCLGFVLSALKLCYLILTNGMSQVRLLIVLVLMVSFFVFRVVLFSLLLSNSLLGESSSRAVNYLLFEFPILLYFCFVTNYISIWLVTLSFSRKPTTEQKRNINLANFSSIVFNLTIFLLFVIMIILFETIVAEPVAICGGRIIQFDEAETFALTMSYRAIFSSIAILIGLLLFVTAIMFGQLLADPYFEIPPLVRYRIYTISIIGGLGLIAQAIYFLVITATQVTPTNYISLSILLVVEIIPALLFVFIESIRTNTNFNSRVTTASIN